MELLSNLLAATGGGSVVAAVVAYLLSKTLKRDEDDRRALAEKVERLEHDRIAKLEEKFDRHVAADRSQEILTKVNALTGMVTRLNDAVGRSLELNAQQEAHLAGHDNWLKNINDAVQDLTFGRTHGRTGK